MKKQYRCSLFIFRRDLRLHDNKGLHHALEASESVIPCFILDPQQIEKQNTYRSMHALQFMKESLKELIENINHHNGTLLLGYEHPACFVEKSIKTGLIDAVFCNYDYTPFSLKRDEEIENVCAAHTIPFIQIHDALLTNPDTIRTQNNSPYSRFTSFFNCAKKEAVDSPLSHNRFSFFTGTINHSLHASLSSLNVAHQAHQWVLGGRSEGLKLVKKIGSLHDYHKTRDVPYLQTSHLSAHLKFGTLSVREVLYEIIQQLGPHHDLIRQLYWRDFFTYVSYHSPFVFGECFYQKYNNLKWDYSKKAEERFSAWCSGETGFPIVDAGMRQLVQTGYMHNRVRMIVASFLTKDLHIDWRWGERFFAQNLIDYDPAVNNGNWQWCASTGCDAQPYFRIFNPWLQQKKFDPHAEYIKTWVKEVADVSPHIIHTAYKAPVKRYPSPIVDHAIEQREAIKRFKSV